MTRDIISLIKQDETQARAAIISVFGASVDFLDIATAAHELLPSEVRQLHGLGVFYENEMIRCRDAKAYFSGCLAGAAMIESFLLLITILSQANVEQTAVFKGGTNSKKTYGEVILGWTLKQLIPVAEELSWIRHTIQPSAVTVLIKIHEDIAPTVRPGITAAEIASGCKYIEDHADLALLHLMQSMRNLIHGGRCVRLKKKLDTDDFAEWAQLVMVLTVEIRDCLILKLKPVCQQYFLSLLNSPEGLERLTRFLSLIGRAAKACSAQQGSSL